MSDKKGDPVQHSVNRGVRVSLGELEISLVQSPQLVQTERISGERQASILACHAAWRLFPAKHKMGATILMQYLGFESKSQGREYTFHVRYSAEDIREFTLMISNEAFASHRVRYQDAPDLCSLKLRRELATNVSHPSKTHFLITDGELDEYRLGHANKPAKAPNAPKSKEDF